MLKLLTCLLLGAILSCVVFSEVVKEYTDCGSTGVLHELRINPCPKVPCDLKKESWIGIEMDFTPKEPVQDLEMQMYGVIGPAEIKFDGVSPKACDNILDDTGNTLCPLTNITEPITYNNTFEVKRTYPPIQIGVMFKLVEVGKSEPIVCFKFPSRIVRAR